MKVNLNINTKGQVSGRTDLILSSSGRVPSNRAKSRTPRFYVQLSKKMSYALRHNPEGCGLKLDSMGRTPIDNMLAFLNSSLGEKITKIDIQETIGRIKKKRFELRDGKIRAYYGHSFSEKVMQEQATPPRILYHGTSHDAAKHIETEGLTHQMRQYVHMSTDKKTAHQVGLRKDKNPVMVFVDTKVAKGEGVKFYRGNENVWLSDDIPSSCLYIDKT